MKKKYICPTVEMIKLTAATLMAGSIKAEIEGETGNVGAKENHMWFWVDDEDDNDKK